MSSARVFFSMMFLLEDFIVRNQQEAIYYFYLLTRGSQKRWIEVFYLICLAKKITSFFLGKISTAVMLKQENVFLFLLHIFMVHHHVSFLNSDDLKD